MMEELERKTLFYALAVIIAFFAIIFILYLLRVVMIPLVASFILVYLLNPLVNFLERKGLRRNWAILILLALAAGIVAGAGALALPVIQGQMRGLSEKLPGYLEGIQERVIPELERITGFAFPKSFKEGLQGLPSVPPALLAPLKNMISYLFSNLYNLIVFSFGLALIPIYTFYLLKDVERLKKFLLDHIPPSMRPWAIEKGNEVLTVLGHFIKGQLFVAVIMGVLYGIGLYFLKMDFAFLVGIVAGLLNLVPYLGLILGLAGASLISLVQFGSFFHLAGVVAIFLMVQALEGFLLTPRILGRGLGLHPLVILVAVVLGGELFGFLGVLLAVPGTAVLKVLLRPLFLKYREPPAIAT